MATLTEYTGNAGLGAGSNADIPVIGNSNLDLINQTSRDLLLLNAQQNQQLFQQKVKDRDTQREMIERNQIQAGEIDPKYRPVYDEAEKRVRDSFNKIQNLSDSKGLEEYNRNVKNLRDITNHAQQNTLMLKKLRQEAASQTLPRKQQAYSQWLGRELDKTDKDFWTQVDPYQQTFDLNLKPILDSWKTATKQYQTPDGLFTIDETHGDYGSTLKGLQSAYLEDADTAEDMRQLLGSFQNYNPQELTRNVDAIDAQIDKYNTERGLTAGQPDFVPHVKRAQMQNGQTVIQESPADFAGKYALANQSGYLTRGSKFNKDIAGYKIDLGELGIKQSRLKAQNAQDYASADNSRASAAKTREELKQMKEDPNKFNAFDKIMALSAGKDFVDATKITGLDLAALGGFNLTKDENGVQSITPNGGFFRPDKNPYVKIGTDAGGNKFIRMTVGRKSNGEPIIKDIYKDDVLNNQNLLTTQLGTKGEQVFGSVEEAPDNQYKLSATGKNGGKAFSNDGRTWFNKEGKQIR